MASIPEMKSPLRWVRKSSPLWSFHHWSSASSADKNRQYVGISISAHDSWTTGTPSVVIYCISQEKCTWFSLKRFLWSIFFQLYHVGKDYFVDDWVGNRDAIASLLEGNLSVFLTHCWTISELILPQLESIFSNESCCISITIWSKCVSRCRVSNISSNNCLAPDRGQEIIWNNDVLVYWPAFMSLIIDVLRGPIVVIMCMRYFSHIITYFH